MGLRALLWLIGSSFPSIDSFLTPFENVQGLACRVLQPRQLLMQETTSLSLLSRIRRSDADGWQRFAHLYTPLVYGWCRQCGVDANVAADVVQDVFIAVHGNIDRFRSERQGGSFRGWLWQITRNKVRDYFRDLRGRPQATGGSTAHAMIEQVPEDEPLSIDGSQPTKQNSLLAIALTLVQAEFEPKTWQAFWRTKIDEAPSSLVAEELGMTQNAIRKARFRILKRLREELADLFEEGSE